MSDKTVKFDGLSDLIRSETIKPLPELIEDGKYAQATSQELKGKLCFVKTNTTIPTSESLSLRILQTIISRKIQNKQKKNSTSLEEVSSSESDPLAKFKTVSFIKENDFGFFNQQDFEFYTRMLGDNAPNFNLTKLRHSRIPFIVNDVEYSNDRATYFARLKDGTSTVVKIYTAPYVSVTLAEDGCVVNYGDRTQHFNDRKAHRVFVASKRERKQLSILKSFNKKNITQLSNGLNNFGLPISDISEVENLYTRNINLRSFVRNYLSSVLNNTEQDYNRYTTKSLYKQFLIEKGFSSPFSNGLLAIKEGKTSLDDLLEKINIEDKPILSSDFFNGLTDLRVMPVIQAEENNNLLYFFFPLINSPTLDEANLTLTETLKSIYSLAEIVDASHTEGILHGDIKPENVFSIEKVRALLFDYDNAVIMRGNYAVETNQACIATPAHVAPEILGLKFNEGGLSGNPEIDKRSDIYSLASTLYSLVVGRTPFMIVDDPITQKMTDEEQKRYHRVSLTYGLKKLETYSFNPKTIFGSLKDFIERTTGQNINIETKDDEETFAYLLGEDSQLRDYGVLYFALNEVGVLDGTFNEGLTKLESLVNSLDEESILFTPEDNSLQKEDSSWSSELIKLDEDVRDYFVNQMIPLFKTYSTLSRLFKSAFVADPKNRMRDISTFKELLNQALTENPPETFGLQYNSGYQSNTMLIEDGKTHLLE